MFVVVCLVVKMQSLLRAYSQSQHFERNNYVHICKGAWDLQEANGLGGGCYFSSLSDYY